MIDFACHGCGERFSVTDTLVGRSAKCRRCGTGLLVPAPKAATPLPPKATPMRLRRLKADYDEMTEALAGCGHIRIKSCTGNPPDLYVVEYLVKGLEAGNKGPAVRD